ncbi:MAG TPA: hypothetical protein VHX43_15960 [Xanthobacteraceae bacterium]|nr:hypothetical protein [Xanthobacteraceae bacterium]
MKFFVAASAQNTDWRQGDVLTTEGARTLGLIHPESADDTVVVIVSHDCDIVQESDIEPIVEAIIGREIDKPNGNYLSAKSARTLHLPFTAGSDTSVIVELSATLKCQIEKSALLAQKPTATAKLSLDERRSLQRWLAIRYFRAAFPDVFVERLGRYGIEERIKKVFANSQTHLTAVYVDLDQDVEVERNGEDDLYTLSIYLVHAVEPDLAASANAGNREISDRRFI